MKSWKITGFIAAVIIVLSVPVYVLKVHYSGISQVEQQAPSAFVGTEKCATCHKREFDLWKGSHHDHAMEVATPETVLGDFNNARFEYFGAVSRFYRKEGRFFVHTQGPEGKMGEFEITHTFGWYPLQQYLIPFPGGRLQCLPIAWDVKKKQWYHLNPEAPVDPKDWLYWTNAGQNWNGMCAECHSTDLKKNYDIQKSAFQTTWSDIDVGCEACHGPGSWHTAWAELPDMARPPVKNYDLVVQSSGIGSRELVELCAPCHSRRAALGDYTHAEPDLLDSMLPALLTEELYFPDGQILDEVYVYGSFTQSKMYHRDVRCSDCHNVHSVKTNRAGNALCLQCHRAEEYDTREHHFHKKKGEKGDPVRSREGAVLFEVGTGAECVQCHMAGRVYMGIDYRPDHSFRIPRPDLSMTLGVPNACNRCHSDRTAAWSNEHITKWYGPGRRFHYGTLIQAGREREDRAGKNLVQMAGDPLYPAIVRATTLSLLGAYPGKETAQAFEKALMNEEALIRRAALEHMRVTDPRRAAALFTPMLYDPVKAVRIEAARRLVGEPAGYLRSDQRGAYTKALKEFQGAMEYSGDFASGQYNLANLYAALNRPEEAVRYYRGAIAIDNLFYPAKVNLAMLYNRMGKKKEAEVLLREVLEEEPQLYDIAYSLGLLMAEEKRYEEAVQYLQRAAEHLPQRARVHYNLGLLLAHLKRDSEAEAALKKTLEIDPGNLDFLYALAEFYLKRGRLEEAKPVAEEMAVKFPSNPTGRNLLNFIRQKTKTVK
ncbi:tetratricopeptide repeat protein [Thermodesulfobacteriota bacterium]